MEYFNVDPDGISNGEIAWYFYLKDFPKTSRELEKLYLKIRNEICKTIDDAGYSNICFVPFIPQKNQKVLNINAIDGWISIEPHWDYINWRKSDFNKIMQVLLKKLPTDCECFHYGTYRRDPHGNYSVYPTELVIATETKERLFRVYQSVVISMPEIYRPIEVNIWISR